MSTGSLFGYRMRKPSSTSNLSVSGTPEESCERVGARVDVSSCGLPWAILMVRSSLAARGWCGARGWWCFMALTTVSNLSGRHPLERWGMASITLAAALLVGYIADVAPT